MYFLIKQEDILKLLVEKGHLPLNPLLWISERATVSCRSMGAEKLSNNNKKLGSTDSFLYTYHSRGNFIFLETQTQRKKVPRVRADMPVLHRCGSRAFLSSVPAMGNVPHGRNSNIKLSNFFPKQPPLVGNRVCI